jgi:hypothetical protein
MCGIATTVGRFVVRSFCVTVYLSARSLSDSLNTSSKPMTQQFQMLILLHRSSFILTSESGSKSSMSVFSHVTWRGQQAMSLA